MIEYFEIDRIDRDLIQAASDVLQKNCQDPRHTVGAAVRCVSGRVYRGVNIESCGYGPDAYEHLERDAPAIRF